MTPAELRALSERATPGPWFNVGHPWRDYEGAYVNAGSADPHGGRIVCDLACQLDARTGEPDTETNDEADADFIAACYPQRISALCRIAEAVEAHLDPVLGWAAVQREFAALCALEAK
jgi:hypothetical protein